MWFRKKKVDLEHHDDLQEAQRAARRAAESIREAENTGKEVTRETVKLKRLRETNNFAEAIRQALGGA